MLSSSLEYPLIDVFLFIILNYLELEKVFVFIVLERLEFTLLKGPYLLPLTASIKHGLHFHLRCEPGGQVSPLPGSHVNG